MNHDRAFWRGSGVPPPRCGEAFSESTCADSLKPPTRYLGIKRPFWGIGRVVADGTVVRFWTPGRLISTINRNAALLSDLLVSAASDPGVVAFL